MKKTKRILSVILVICLALSVSVPSVFAGDNYGVLEYTFGFDTSVLASGSKFTGSAVNPYAGDSNVNPGYPIVSGNGYFLNMSDINSKRGFTGYKGTFQAEIKYADNWFAFEISGINKGTYNMDFVYQDKDSMGNYNIYLIPRAQYNTAIGVENLVKLSQGTALDTDTNTGILTNLSSYIINANNIGQIEKDETTGEKHYAMGNVYFPEQGAYVLLLRSVAQNNGNAKFYLNSLTMTPVLATVEVGETTTDCTTADALAAAIENANPGTKITLQSDATVADFTLNSDVTLDLNGKTLNASVNDAAGEIIDSSGGAGRVKGATLNNIAADQLVLKDKDNYLHICDYTLSKPEDYAEKSQDGNTVTFWFDVRFKNPAVYKLIAESDDAFSVSATFAWNGVEAGTAQFATGMSVKGWAELMQESENFSFYVKVTGLNAATASGELSVLPTITGGATLSGMTYNVTAVQ